MVSLREAQHAAAKSGIGLQYVLKESRVFDIWSKICPVFLSKAISNQATIICDSSDFHPKVIHDGRVFEPEPHQFAAWAEPLFTHESAAQACPVLHSHKMQFCMELCYGRSLPLNIIFYVAKDRAHRNLIPSTENTQT
jgi:hypothetical protein